MLTRRQRLRLNRLTFGTNPYDLDDVFYWEFLEWIKTIKDIDSFSTKIKLHNRKSKEYNSILLIPLERYRDWIISDNVL